jgi:hypothetical protein
VVPSSCSRRPAKRIESAQVDIYTVDMIGDRHG